MAKIDGIQIVSCVTQLCEMKGITFVITRDICIGIEMWMKFVL